MPSLISRLTKQYDPDQPRVPAGNSAGGQFASGSGGGEGGGDAEEGGSGGGGDSELLDQDLTDFKDGDDSALKRAVVSHYVSRGYDRDEISEIVEAQSAGGWEDMEGWTVREYMDEQISMAEDAEQISPPRPVKKSIISALLKAYNKDQPRQPKGKPTGGQFASGGSGGSSGGGRKSVKDMSDDEVMGELRARGRGRIRGTPEFRRNTLENMRRKNMKHDGQETPPIGRKKDKRNDTGKQTGRPSYKLKSGQRASSKEDLDRVLGPDWKKKIEERKRAHAEGMKKGHTLIDRLRA